MSIVYKSEVTRGYQWQALCAEQAPEHAFHIWPDEGQPEKVRYLIAWQPPGDLIARFPNLEVLFSIGAGVDQLDLDTIPTSLPVVRMIDPGLTQGMIEYVTCAVLALQRDLPTYLRQQRNHEWQPLPQRTASSTHIGVMGLGELGQAVLGAWAVETTNGKMSHAYFFPFLRLQPDPAAAAFVERLAAGGASGLLYFRHGGHAGFACVP